MAKEGMVTKGVTFNVYDEDQKEILDYANKRPNFSAYIKRLIQRDMIEKKIEAHDKKVAELERTNQLMTNDNNNIN